MAERTVSIEKEASRGTYRGREDLRLAEVAGDVNLAQGVPGLARAQPTRQQSLLVGEEVLIRPGVCLAEGLLTEDFAVSIVGKDTQVPGVTPGRMRSGWSDASGDPGFRARKQSVHKSLAVHEAASYQSPSE